MFNKNIEKITKELDTLISSKSADRDKLQESIVSLQDVVTKSTKAMQEAILNDDTTAFKKARAEKDDAEIKIEMINGKFDANFDMIEPSKAKQYANTISEMHSTDSEEFQKALDKLVKEMVALTDEYLEATRIKNVVLRTIESSAPSINLQTYCNVLPMVEIGTRVKGMPYVRDLLNQAQNN